MKYQKNPYPGVNAHINSFLQQPGGGWEMFHSNHINDIQLAIEATLPDDYYTTSEKSLQITESYGDDITRIRTIPDISVYRGETSDEPSTATSVGSTPTAVLPMSETYIDPEDVLMSVGIYKIEPDKYPGKLVTRIELLSPSNKPPQAGYKTYTEKRFSTLEAGVNLVEIDYLHRYKPVLPVLPSYPDGHTDATPYSIIVNDPHPSQQEGKVFLYAVQINQPLVNVTIPLLNDDYIVVDLQAAYNSTIERRRVYEQVVNYTAEPVNFDAYTEADQQRIREMMTTFNQD